MFKINDCGNGHVDISCTIKRQALISCEGLCNKNGAANKERKATSSLILAAIYNPMGKQSIEA